MINTEEDWKTTDLNVDSLWLIDKRDSSGKHENNYHGNFIPQIPNQLIRRYTNHGDTVLELFTGSGTTLYECEKLNRNYIGFDINSEMITYINQKMEDTQNIHFLVNECDVTDTEKKEDLSNISDLDLFIEKFTLSMKNGLQYLAKNKYFAVVIGDVYKKSEVVPLGFYVMDAIKKNFKVKMKGIIVKNIEGNRGKLGSQGIWKYRAMNSDYYLFKHEYRRYS